MWVWRSVCMYIYIYLSRAAVEYHQVYSSRYARYTHADPKATVAQSQRYVFFTIFGKLTMKVSVLLVLTLS